MACWPRFFLLFLLDDFECFFFFLLTLVSFGVESSCAALGSAFRQSNPLRIAAVIANHNSADFKDAFLAAGTAPSAAKAAFIARSDNTAEAVPFPNPILKTTP